jgi:hypothetical protein
MFSSFSDVIIPSVHDTIGIQNQVTIQTVFITCWYSCMPLHTFLTFFIIQFLSISLTLSFRNLLSLFFSFRLTYLSPFTWLQSCNYFIRTIFLISINLGHYSWNSSNHHLFHKNWTSIILKVFFFSTDISSVWLYNILSEQIQVSSCISWCVVLLTVRHLDVAEFIQSLHYHY